MKKLFLVGVDKDMLFTIRDEKLGHVIGYAALKSSPSLDIAFFGDDQQAVVSLPAEAVGIMSLDQGAAKRAALEVYTQRSIDFETIISTDAIVSAKAKIGKGSIVQKKAFVSDDVIIGKFVKIQIGVNILHEVCLRDFVTVAPNATVLGNVDIGIGTYVGAGATIRQNIKIGENCLIGAGAVVVKDVADGVSVVGVPAKPL